MSDHTAFTPFQSLRPLAIGLVLLGGVDRKSTRLNSSHT